MTSLFITGTDTNVGKTIISALLIHHLSKSEEHLTYVKAIQTGIERECDVSLIQRLTPEYCALKSQRLLAFRRPLSPHLAAHYANENIDFKSLVHQSKAVLKESLCIVEGSGGVFVPIDRRYFMIDFIKALALPTVVVARSGLGTINHTLLSIEAFRRRNIAVHGVIMVGDLNKDNERSIKFYGRITKILCVPWLPLIDRASLAKLADDLTLNLDSFLKHHD